MVSTRWILKALACPLLAVSAQQSAEIEGLANILFITDIVPDQGLASLAAQILVGGANTTSIALREALLAPGIDERKRTSPELYYSYGRSPPVYPSRTSFPRLNDIRGG
jgi:beta-glucosidase